MQVSQISSTSLLVDNILDWAFRKFAVADHVFSSWIYFRFSLSWTKAVFSCNTFSIEFHVPPWLGNPASFLPARRVIPSMSSTLPPENILFYVYER